MHIRKHDINFQLLCQIMKNNNRQKTEGMTMRFAKCVRLNKKILTGQSQKKTVGFLAIKIMGR